MYDLNNYIECYGNLDFTEYPFQDIDNLILSQIPYLEWFGIIGPIGFSKITLEEAVIIYLNNCSKKEQKNYLYKKVIKMIKKIYKTKRYRDALLYNYTKTIDSEIQFGAICIELNDKSVYIAYEGTDSSISGWHEDFSLCYTDCLPSGKMAISYLNKVITINNRQIRVGGHSKGGNLALWAAMGCKTSIRKRIIKIYNNDGPGLHKKIITSKKYKKIAQKIKLLVPNQSVIGMLFYHDFNYTVVKSKAKGVLQHDPFTWVCSNNGNLITTSLSPKSKAIEDKFCYYLDNITIDDKKQYVDDLFNVFAEMNITSVNDIKCLSCLKTLKLAKGVLSVNLLHGKKIASIIKLMFLPIKQNEKVTNG